MSLNSAADVAAILQFLLWLIVTFGGGLLVIGYIHKMRPVWKRFASNVSRQMAVMSTEKQSMEHEADLLDRVGYFKRIKRLDADERNLNLLHDTSLIVIGYSPNSKVYKATLSYAKANKLPIVVYSGDHRLSPEDLINLKKYSFGSLCETELRLVSDVFAVMSTFPKAES